VRGQRLEAKAVDLFLEVPGCQVPVDLGRDPRILLSHDPLHRRQVGALHEQQRRRRVAQVVEAQLPHLADREQLEVALRAAPGVRVGRWLAMAAPLAPALVDVAGDDPGSAHRAPENVLEGRVLRAHVSVLVREDELGGGGGDRALQVSVATTSCHSRPPATPNGARGSAI
jgi:hypothetical protein